MEYTLARTVVNPGETARRDPDGEIPLLFLDAPKSEVVVQGMALGRKGGGRGAYLLFPKSRVEMRGGSRDKTFSICATKTFSSRREDIGAGKGGPPCIFLLRSHFCERTNVQGTKSPPRYYV